MKGIYLIAQALIREAKELIGPIERSLTSSLEQAGRAPTHSRNAPCSGLSMPRRKAASTALRSPRMRA